MRSLTQRRLRILGVSAVFVWGAVAANQGTILAQGAAPASALRQDPPSDQQRWLAALAKEARRNSGKAVDPALVKSALTATFGQKAAISSDEQFVSEKGGATFTWRTYERYDDSWRAWRGLRTVAVNEPTPHTETMFGYGPSFEYHSGLDRPGREFT
ncbi:MAG: hypothetical protein QOJ42_2563 [Acidobacteriaceae bacterium]|nr:hypothetical protein [Acidobacteriaceae bacterium]